MAFYLFTANVQNVDYVSNVMDHSREAHQWA